MSQSPSKLSNCSFCGKPHKAVKLLIESPDSCICDECTGHFKRLLQTNVDLEFATPQADCQFCSFMYDEGIDCMRKSNRRMFRKDSARICEDCVDTCCEIVLEKYQRDSKNSKS